METFARETISSIVSGMMRVAAFGANCEPESLSQLTVQMTSRERSREAEASRQG